MPLAKELKELGWENHAAAWVCLIHETSEMEDVDLGEATEKIMGMVKYMSSARKVARYASAL